jgi:hypothetical protein
MNNQEWEELYLLATTEVDGRRVPERVAAVREAIRARLQDLETSSDHHEERVRLASTLKRLGWLEVEAQKW